MRERYHRTSVGRQGVGDESVENKNGFVLPLADQAAKFNCPGVIQ